jgi:adenosylcobinamide hydrolase
MSERGAGDAAPDAGADVTVTAREDVCRVRAPAEWDWLVTGRRGGDRRARAAYNVTVPKGFDRTDLEAYARGRRSKAGFDAAGPALLTGVSMRHARVAARGPVTVVATGGLSNPATLPVDGSGAAPTDSTSRPPFGTVNLLVATDRALAPGTRAELLATAVEAKTATLLPATGFTGTTSDAVAVGCDPAGDPATFAGSATAVGAATRVCVRDALLAALRSRYADREGELPDAVPDADHGVVTDGPTRLFEPTREG